MKPRKTAFITILIILLMQLPMAVVGQDFIDDVCRIENGRIIFRINLNWNRDEVKQISGLFNLDTLLLNKIMAGAGDSLMLADGWLWKKINNRTAEISRAMIPPLANEQDSSPTNPLSRLFLIDDILLHAGGLPEPEQVNYGVNKLDRDNAFSYADSIARFFLPGYKDVRQIFISGTFNDWSTSQTPVKKIDGGWTVSLPIKPGKYQYKYIIDGRWTQDPGNKLKADDLNGGYNSVIFCYNYRFRLDGYPEAKKVIVAGSFNGFNPRELSMNHTDGGWELPMFLKPGTHAYKFVVDGNWMNDPLNKVVRPDGRGNFNSFMAIGDTTWFRLKGYESAKSVILSGSFNAWNAAELNMEKIAGGWQLPYVLAPGNYEYKYIADGRWMRDTANPYSNGGGDQANSFMAVEPNHNFVLEGYPKAKQVAVSGSFNGWSRSGYHMTRVNNRWVLPLFLNPGKYTYKLIIDGKWILDPGNELWEENEYGTGNSVLWINR